MGALKDLLYGLGAYFAGIVKALIGWFMDLSFLNKIILINIIPSFFAITLPVAKYYIFESWMSINNPIAVYLIFIVVMMVVTVFFHGPAVLGVRVVANLWYFIAVIVMHAARTISHAPYELSFGFYINLLAPAVYIALSVLIYLSEDS